jgi:hypothetical protein
MMRHAEYRKKVFVVQFGLSGLSCLTGVGLSEVRILSPRNAPPPYFFGRKK